MGRSLEKNAYNLGLLDTLTQVLEDLGFSAADLFETGARRRPGQRRSGSSGRLLPGLHDHFGDPGHRLFHLL